MKKFVMQHRFLGGRPEVFTEATAPDWLTSCKTVRGSTMDNRWFWEKHVLTLRMAQRIQTDFRTITRIA